MSGQMDSLLSIFEENIARHSEKNAFEYLDSTTGKKNITYGELYAKSQAIAAYLQQHTHERDTVLLSYSPGLDFICAFLGCLYAGVIAVPAYPLRSNHHSKRFLLMLEDCQPSLICGTYESLIFMQKHEEFSSYRYIFTEEIESGCGANYAGPIITSDRLAFLQYTSGSTGSPKGVMVSHGNLVANVRAIHHYYQLTAKDKMVLWLPMQHDMGLAGGLMYTLYVGMTELFMSPATFLANPFLWLKTISDYQASTSGGPNFCYQLCVDKLDEQQIQSLDLSNWEIAFNGSEPLRSPTMDAFADKFRICGFKKDAFLPCYGMAETTLLVSGKAYKTSYITEVFGKSILVSSGQAHQDYTLRIVNPETLKETHEGKVGEIWVSGPSVAQGYWNKEQLTEETFRATLAEDDNKYLRTGDLGFLKHNELYITGRLKDLIILHGRNIYPQDVEKAVEACHPAIRSGCSAAFSVEMNQQEQLIVVAEIERTHRKIDFQPVFHAIRKAVSDAVEAIPYSIQLLSPAQALKTTSGKIQRKATQLAYLDHTLVTLAHDELFVHAMDEIPSQSELEEVITQLLTKVLAVDSIERTARYSELGGTSLQAVLFQQQLQEYLGDKLEVSASVILDYPSIAQLSDYLYACLTGQAHRSENYSRKISFAEQPIAIVGMACRFPGNASTPEAFWKLLEEGRDGIQDVPATRWNWHEHDAELSNHQGGFIENIEWFAPEFFNISPREATSMDPQQRLVLETTWEAFENASIVPHTLIGSDTSVFAGATTHEYSDLLLKGERKDSYMATGNSASALAGRVSYTFGFQGPSLSIDTACSSSLVALYEACNSLHLGETSLAIVAGVNALVSPEGFIQLSKANMLSRRGYCQVFSDEADGYVRGEGCGVILLKRLSEAQRDNNIILGVIKGAVVNQDGASSGFTVPNGAAQEKLINQALADASLKAEDIDYIETHGTGTVLGDPMETHALSRVFSGSHQHHKPLVIGSVKANVGHLEAAAGMAGIIKVILSLQHQKIPPQIHIKHINSKIQLDAIPAQIPLESVSWEKDKNRKRRAGISSFGFTGTNAHVIIEEAESAKSVASDSERAESTCQFILSAKTKEALAAYVQQYIDFLTANPQTNLADMCYTVQMGRELFAHTILLKAATSQELLNKLEQQDFTIYTRTEIEPFLQDIQKHASANYRKINLPTYPFERQLYWVEKLNSNVLLGEKTSHPLWSAKTSLSDGDCILDGLLDLQAQPYLREHQLFEEVIFPGAGFIDAMLSLQRIFELTDFHLENIILERPLVLTEKRLRVQLMAKEEKTEYQLALYHEHHKKWMVHAHAHLAEYPTPLNTFESLDELRSQCPEILPQESLYERFSKSGVHYGTSFKVIQEIRKGEGCLLVTLHTNESTEGYSIFPALLDGAFQALGLMAYQQDKTDTVDAIYLPASMGSVILHGEANSAHYAFIQQTEKSPQHISADLRLLDEHGRVVLSINHFNARRTNQAQLKQLIYPETISYVSAQWQPLENALSEVLEGKWAVWRTQDDDLIDALLTNLSDAEIIDTLDGTNKTYQGIFYPVSNNPGDAFTVLQSAIRLMQMFIKQHPTPKLIFVTQGLYSGENVVAGSLLSLVKTVLQEDPDQSIQLIDSDDMSQISVLARRDEPIIAFDHNKEYVHRLLHLPVVERAGVPLNIQAEATYLITGGLGDLGLATARWLVAKGARALVLLGRKAPSQKAKAQIEALYQQHSDLQIQTLQADVSDEEEVKAVLDSLRPKNLKGIFHLAGRVDDGIFQEQTVERFEKVFKPKAQAAWYLHQCTQDLKLDYFVLFSSIASSMGSPGQSNYAAANGFLDQLALYRHHCSLPATSINWGAWAIGMAKRSGVAYDKRGMVPLSEKDGFNALTCCLQQPHPVIQVADIQWSLLAKTLGHIPTWLNALAEANPQHRQGTLVALLEQTPKAQQEAVLKSEVFRTVRGILALAANQPINEQVNFFEMGMDSLMAMELRNRLQNSLGNQVLLPEISVFYNQTIEGLSHIILETIKNKLATSGKTNASVSPQHTWKDTDIDNRNDFARFDCYPDYLDLKKQLQMVSQFTKSPIFLDMNDGIARDTTYTDGKRKIHFSGYNYLGMSGDPLVSAASIEAIKKYGTSVSASRVASGDRPLHHQLEKTIAAFIGVEDAVVMTAGFLTNATTISYLFGEHDTIMMDSLAHNSIVYGATASGATRYAFPHHDLIYLEKLLQELRDQYQRALIIIEGVYSADGDIPNLPAFIELKKRYDAILMVDEAHSIGTIGKTGRGISEYYQINPADVDIWMGTLSKSLASCGGYIAGSAELIELLKYRAPGFVYSCGLTPANSAASLAALEICIKEPWRVARLQSNADFFRNKLKEYQVNIGLSHDSPVIPVIVGESETALLVNKLLRDQGVYCHPMVYPAVEKNKARMRLFVNCLHTEDQLQAAADNIAAIYSSLKIDKME